MVGYMLSKAERAGLCVEGVVGEMRGLCLDRPVEVTPSRDQSATTYSPTMT